MSTPLPQVSPQNAVSDSPAIGEPTGASDPAVIEQQALANEVAALLARGKNGAHWFYWIAALSLITSAIILGGGDRHFVIGLGITLLSSSIASAIAQQSPEAALALKIGAFTFSLIVAAIVAGFGWMSAKRYTVVMAIGMVLYVLDGMLYLLIQDWMSIGFHAFALFCMWNGLSAFRQLNALEESLARPAEAELLQANAAVSPPLR